MKRLTQRVGVVLLTTAFLGSWIGGAVARVWADEASTDPSTDPCTQPTDPSTDPCTPPTDNGTVSTQ